MVTKRLDETTWNLKQHLRQRRLLSFEILNRGKRCPPRLLSRAASALAFPPTPAPLGLLHFRFAVLSEHSGQGRSPADSILGAAQLELDGKNESMATAGTTCPRVSALTTLGLSHLTPCTVACYLRPQKVTVPTGEATSDFSQKA